MGISASSEKDILFGKSIDEWARGAHRDLCEKTNIPHTPLFVGDYQYYTLVNSLKKALTAVDEYRREISVVKLAEIIHTAAAESYIYLSMNTLWKNQKEEISARLAFVDLQADEQQKYIILAGYLLNNIE